MEFLNPAILDKLEPIMIFGIVALVLIIRNSNVKELSKEFKDSIDKLGEVFINSLDKQSNMIEKSIDRQSKYIEKNTETLIKICSNQIELKSEVGSLKDNLSELKANSRNNSRNSVTP